MRHWACINHFVTEWTVMKADRSSIQKQLSHAQLSIAMLILKAKPANANWGPRIKPSRVKPSNAFSGCFQWVFAVWNGHFWATTDIKLLWEKKKKPQTPAFISGEPTYERKWKARFRGVELLSSPPVTELNWHTGVNTECMEKELLAREGKL